METFLIKALQLILSLAILVFVHELGHFLFARLFKVRVEKFYLFFNPKKSLVRAKKINGRWQVLFFADNVPANERPRKDEDGDTIKDAKGNPKMELIPLDELPDGDWRKYPESTEWGIGWLPLGGYCKIAGMIDESMDTTQMASEPQPWEYRSRPAWQRLPIILGGVFFNFIFAIAIYAMMLFAWGDTHLPMKNIPQGMNFSQEVRDAGFKNGDIIVSADGRELSLRDGILAMNATMRFVNAQSVVVKRDGEFIIINPSEDFGKKVIFSRRAPFEMRMPDIPPIVGEVANDTEAARIGLQTGDKILSVNNVNIDKWAELGDEIRNNLNQTIPISFLRSDSTYFEYVTIDSRGILGVTVYTDTDIVEVQLQKDEFGFFPSFVAGTSRFGQMLQSYVAQFRFVFTREGAQNLGGFAAIGSMFPPTWNWKAFWSMTALLSIMLGFINILPIPALDGGHFMFILYEMITGRKPNQRFMEVAQTVGFFILIALVLFSNGNDIFKLFR
jgi:regulator of sigma E protease